MKELKPCPFCGESVRLGVFCSDTDPVSIGVRFETPVAVALCFHCAAAAGFVKIGPHKRDEAINGAAEYWNQRATEQEADNG